MSIKLYSHIATSIMLSMAKHNLSLFSTSGSCIFLNTTRRGPLNPGKQHTSCSCAGHKLHWIELKCIELNSFNSPNTLDAEVRPTNQSKVDIATFVRLMKHILSPNHITNRTYSMLVPYLVLILVLISMINRFVRAPTANASNMRSLHKPMHL